MWVSDQISPLARRLLDNCKTHNLSSFWRPEVLSEALSNSEAFHSMIMEMFYICAYLYIYVIYL